jgi:dephospho-CoA kinase
MRTCPILGLLGGVGSGKSTVAAFLARRGALVLDADRYAKDFLFDPDVLQEIRQAFGNEIFQSTGDVDRSKLADIVFSDEIQRKKLNSIIHPRVRKRFKEEIATAREESLDRLIVLDVPLLLGSELKAFCNLLVMVRAPLERRVEWVRQDRSWEEEELNRRDDCQPSLAEKERAAQIIIENDGNLKDLEGKVEAFLETIIQ